MQLSADQVLAILPHAPALRVASDLPFIREACEEAQITTGLRLAAFLAQVGVETDQLRRFEESLNYSADALVQLWPRHFDAETAAKYAHKPEMIAARAYANRMGNGDEASGDGWTFRGRGGLQSTGREAYAWLSEVLGFDLLAEPHRLADPDLAYRAAGAFWSKHQLNAFADQGRAGFPALTHCVNGGLTDEPMRERFLANGLRVLAA